MKDEVERDCFVSRIYAWFMDKLTERRDLDKEKVRAVQEAAQPDAEDSVDLLAEPMPAADQTGPQQLYSKHAYHTVSGKRPPGESAKPEDNMGMIFLNEPQTEAELEMYNLWLAKRQQEVGIDIKCCLA